MRPVLKGTIGFGLVSIPVRLFSATQESELELDMLDVKDKAKNYDSLHGVEAVEKLQDIVKDRSICMFHTDLHAEPCETRPMVIQRADDMGGLWLLSARSSQKNTDIAKDPRVMLTVAEPGRSRFLVVHGRANIVEGRAMKQELWSNLEKAWFPGSADDPELTLLNAEPTACYYWDTLDGRLVSLLKIATAAVTGYMNDSGSVEGALKV